jgi:hypothetical protein
MQVSTDNLRPTRSSRLFPPPWKVVEIPGGFRVQDANSRALAYVYFYLGSDGGEDEFLTYSEALGIADQIARAPDRSTVESRGQRPNPAVLKKPKGLMRHAGGQARPLQPAMLRDRCGGPCVVTCVTPQPPL